MHPDVYLRVVEDAEVTITDRHRARSSPDVRSACRADGPTPAAARCSASAPVRWAGSLSHNGYDNDIVRLTDNVLSAFVS